MIDAYVLCSILGSNPSKFPRKCGWSPPILLDLHKMAPVHEFFPDSYSKVRCGGHMFRSRSLSLLRLALALTFIFSGLAVFAQTEHVIIRSTGSREVLRQKVQALGGQIQHEFQNVTAVSAIVPSVALNTLTTDPQFKVHKAGTFSLPVPLDPKGVDRGVVPVKFEDKILLDSGAVVKTTQSLPADYSFNNSYTDATPLHAAGHIGQGIVVAVIDSGTANNPDVVPDIDGTVIGGENFVPASQDTVTSATSTKNYPHGTWVGSMIAGHALFLFQKTSCFAQSIIFNAPDSIADGSAYGVPDYYVVPMIGVAPGASIYALKVFPSGGGGAPEDRIIAAMDRAITLKKNFLAGQPSVAVSGTGTEDDPFVYNSLNIGVVNMSLGGPTTEAGRDLEDLLTREMLKADITLATSAGNAGPAGLTTGSPSTGFGSISSAASITPAHERIYRDLPSPADPTTCRLGRGTLFHPTNTIKTAYFSSRGPTADGRVGVDVISAGYYNFAQGADGLLYFISGTSFAAPSVAGAAALLREAAPNATGIQVRNAILQGANPNVMGDKSTRFDEGKGYLDVAKSLYLLQTKKIDKSLPAFQTFSNDVGLNLLKLGIPNFPILSGVPFPLNANSLLPGQRREFVLKVGKEIGSLDFSIRAVRPKLPPQFQNQIFGDDVIVSVHQAKTSAHGEGDYPQFNFYNGPADFRVDNPEPGYMRVTVSGDWTNAGEISTELWVTPNPKPGATFKQTGSITEGDLQFIPYNVNAGKQALTVQLTWDHDWTAYPTNDLDLILVDPDGNLYFDGATLNGRETQQINNPKAGTWTIIIDGFDVFGKVAANGTDTGTKADNYTVKVY
jgi:subtilisin family serine protease